MRRETFETPGPTAVSVKVPAGTIRFEARPAATTTEVTLEVLKGDPELERQATIELHERGDRHELRIEAPKRRFGIGREDYAVTVAVPEGSDVETRTGSADVRGHGRFGRVDSTTGSGEIEFDDVDGDLRAKSASGDISVRNVGASASVDTASGDVELGAVAAEGRLRSASGDVTVREAAAGMSIHTASGDQSIGSAAAGRLTLRSASGDVLVGIRRGSRVFVDARSASGEMDSELQLDDHEPATDGPLVEVDAVTASGDVRIVRA